MERIAQFEKVSFEQYKKDFEALKIDKNVSIASEEQLREIYDSIKLPQRATSGSAGYDFYLPFGMYLFLEQKCVIPTGIRCKINEGWVLSLYPRSGLGFKYGMSLSNTVGIIDSDYYNSSNEGHIMLSFTTGSDRYYNNGLNEVKKGSAICQGIFTQFGITVDDNPVSEIRDGGFGSTDIAVTHSI